VEAVALAQAPHRAGVDVRYGIRSVAGRMPGHMKVLAETNAPYGALHTGVLPDDASRTVMMSRARMISSVHLCCPTRIPHPSVCIQGRRSWRRGRTGPCGVTVRGDLRVWALGPSPVLRGFGGPQTQRQGRCLREANDAE
jgi:hypothetical protein